MRRWVFYYNSFLLMTILGFEVWSAFLLFTQPWFYSSYARCRLLLVTLLSAVFFLRENRKADGCSPIGWQAATFAFLPGHYRLPREFCIRITLWKFAHRLVFYQFVIIQRLIVFLCTLFCTVEARDTLYLKQLFYRCI